jgi:hypothetical protein
VIPEWLKDALAAFLGNALCFALMGYLGKTWIEHRLTGALAQRARRADYLRAQLTNLYGPLAFLIEASARCLESQKAIVEKGSEYFSRYTSPGSARATTDMDLMLKTANRYIDERVQENNVKCIDLLRAQWGWLDHDDVEIAGRFIGEMDRLAVEFPDGRRLLPLPLYVDGALDKALETPSFIRPEFIDRVREKLAAKQRELSGLTGSVS